MTKIVLIPNVIASRSAVLKKTMILATALIVQDQEKDRLMDRSVPGARVLEWIGEKRNRLVNLTYELENISSNVTFC